MKKTLPKKSSVKKVIKTKKTSNSEKSNKIIITAALPYANGPIHIGHLLEYIQADIFTRFLKLTGKDALYICASDMHGTPIEVNARKAGMEPKQFTERFWKEHQEDFSKFLIKFDNYYKTESPENKELAEYFFSQLKKKNLIYRKKIKVIYCRNCARSLPDRFVRGTCPLCGTADQYGDVCENCGSALKGIDLINPKCSLCGKTPLQKDGEHYFFKLSLYAHELKKWMGSENFFQPEVKNWLKGWLDKGLEDWCVSRDAPYYGFEIPSSEKEIGEKKFFYVWLDAPIGYISSTKNYTDAHRQAWEDYWKKGQVYHFIGKDISYFHFLFWPAMLMAVGIPLPKLTVHGYITVNGQKMSKSRGTFFTAKDFLKLYCPETLRFYYASHLDRKVVDIDLNFEDFKSVINTVLVGCSGNFCYRVLTFAGKNYGRISSKDLAKNVALEKEFFALADEVKKDYAQQDFKSAVRNILKISDLGNAYFQKSEAWKSPESPESKKVVGWCLNLARNLSILISPIMPEFSEKIWNAIGEKNLLWTDLNFSWKGKIGKIDLLVDKIETVPTSSRFPLRMMAGKIREVKDHPNADSLYLMKVDFGSQSGFGVKQVVAGLKKHFKKEDLLGRKAVFCLNLKPAKLRGEISEAMVFAADDGEKVALLEVPKTPIGEEVHFEGTESNQAEITFDEFKLLKLEVFGGKVFCNGKKLVSKLEDVSVKGVKEGTRIY